MGLIAFRVSIWNRLIYNCFSDNLCLVFVSNWTDSTSIDAVIGFSDEDDETIEDNKLDDEEEFN